MTTECPECGNAYKGVAQHWNMSECKRPSFNKYQKEIITGILMGDGSISKQGKRNSRLQAKMISPNYLKYVDKQMGIFGRGVKMVLTAEDSAELARNSGFRPGAKKENYSDLYQWRTMSHPELNEFYEWYSTGKKVWPEDIELTPTVLKHWYCGDGTWSNVGRRNNIRIAMSNERKNTKKVDRMFDNSGLPAPSNYATSERKDGGKTCSAEFTKSQSKELWKYMGEPLPDFEYKWPEQYRNTYPDRERNMGTQ